MRETRDLVLELDLPPVVDAIDAVDDHGDGSLTEAQYTSLCRYAKLRCDVLAYRRKLGKTLGGAEQSASPRSGSHRATVAIGISTRHVLELVFASYYPGRVHAAYEELMRKRKTIAKQKAAVEAAAKSALADAVPGMSSSDAALETAGDIAGIDQIFKRCDADGDGLVSYSDLRAHLRGCPADYMAEMVLRHSPEASEIRAVDVAALRELSLWDLLTRAHLPAAALSRLTLMPPLTVANAASKWGSLRGQLAPHLSADEMDRMTEVVLVLKRHGPMALAKLAWPTDLRRPPPQFTVEWDLCYDCCGAPRPPPVTIATAKLPLSNFKRLFHVASNTLQWGNFTNDDPDGNGNLGILASFMRKVPRERPFLTLPRPGLGTSQPSQPLRSPSSSAVKGANVVDPTASLMAEREADGDSDDAHVSSSEPGSQIPPIAEQLGSVVGLASSSAGAVQSNKEDTTFTPPVPVSPRGAQRWPGTAFGVPRSCNVGTTGSPSFVCSPPKPSQYSPTAGRNTPAPPPSHVMVPPATVRPASAGPKLQRTGLTAEALRMTRPPRLPFGEAIRRAQHLHHYDMLTDAMDRVVITPRAGIPFAAPRTAAATPLERPLDSTPLAAAPARSNVRGCVDAQPSKAAAGHATNAVERRAHLARKPSPKDEEAHLHDPACAHRPRTAGRHPSGRRSVFEATRPFRTLPQSSTGTWQLTTA